MPQLNQQIFTALDPLQQEKIIQQFCRTLTGNEIIAFYGDLGSGKTFSIRVIGEYFKVTEPITSPSFNLMNIYLGKVKIYHIDLYRINDPQELELLEWDYIIKSDGLILIEWAEKAKDYLPVKRIDIEINYLSTPKGKHPPRGRKLIITRNLQ